MSGFNNLSVSAQDVINANSFNVNYTPVVDVHETQLNGSPLSPGNSLQHTFVTPSSHISLEADDRPRLIIGESLRPLHELDIPTWRTLSGCVIILLMSSLVVSLFVCLARPDFNFVFYLFGYYIWCIESTPHPHSIPVSSSEYPNTSRLHVVTKQNISSVQYFTIMLTAASIIDSSWLILGFSTWLCKEEGSSGEHCFKGSDQSMILRFNMVYHLYQFVIIGSLVNLIIKIAIIILSCVWLRQQKHHLQNLLSNSSLYTH